MEWKVEDVEELECSYFLATNISDIPEWFPAPIRTTNIRVSIAKVSFAVLQHYSYMLPVLFSSTRGTDNVLGLQENCSSLIGLLSGTECFQRWSDSIFNEKENACSNFY